MDPFFMEGFPMPIEGFGNGVPAPHQPVLPDLNLPAEPPQEDKPWVPLAPLVGSLSIEEQKEIARLVSFEKSLIRKSTYMLQTLKYTPNPEDVKNVVSSFVLDMDSAKFDEIMLAITNLKSPVFQAFLEAWEDYIGSIYKYPIDIPEN